MGLDIYHFRATLGKAPISSTNEVNAIFREDAAQFDVPFEYFRDYIQEVDYHNTLRSAILVNEKKDLESTRDRFKEYRDHVLLRDRELTIDQQLKEFEFLNGLTHLHKFIGEVAGKVWTFIDYYEVQKREGFYYEEVGYQRKGMKDGFYHRFYLDDIIYFTGKENFDFAYDQVGDYRNSDTEEDLRQRKEAFKRDFIDKYRDGASFMLLSY